MRKIGKIVIVLALMVVVFSGLPAMAAEFEYKDGPKDDGWFNNQIRYYEVEKDYSIDLTEYFADDNIGNLPPALPLNSTLDLIVGALWDTLDFFDRLMDLDLNLPDYGVQPLGWQKTDDQIQALQDHIEWLKTQGPIKWDFIELDGGVLTVKKGYRWDGASTVWNDCNIFNNVESYLPGSCLHDSIYDLMRMGYLENDYLGNTNINDEGYLNRLMADCLMYMIFKEDRLLNPLLEINFVRYGGAGKTQEGAKNLCGHPLLAGWKYHASELTAWASDGKIELRFLPADAALKDPNGYGTQRHIYAIWRKEGSADSSAPWSAIAPISDDASVGGITYYSEDWDVFYTDHNVEPGRLYSYRVELATDESDADGDHRHYDESNVESVATPTGRGNALWLNNYPAFTMKQNFVSADLVSNDLGGASISLEAWVYPEAQDGPSAILAFNTPSGGNLNLLMCEYDSEKVQFVYQDSTTGKIYSAEYDPDRWYHVAVTINASGVGNLYVNGAEQAPFTTDIRPSRTALFSMGQVWDWDGGLTPSNFFKGRVDEVRVWTVARTQNQIQDGMSHALRGDETGLAGLWHFDEPGRAFYAYDATPNGNDGSFTTYFGGSLLPNIRIPHVPSDAMTPFVDPASGLLARYRFDGNAYDDVNHNDGTVEGASLAVDRFGNADSAYGFDGNDYISLPSVIAFGEGDNTVTCWVKIPTDVSGRVGIVLGNHPSGYNSANFEIHEDGQLRIYWNRGIIDLYTDFRINNF